MHSTFRSSVHRLIIAAGLGLLAGLLSALTLTYRGAGAGDLAWPLLGARYLIAGTNPYTAPGYPLGLPLYYPLPALLLLIPLAWLPDTLAAALFFGSSCALLAWALLRDAPHRLWVFASAPFVTALWLAQWSPLIMALILLPGAWPWLLVKPQFAVPALARRPVVRRWVIAASLGLLLLSWAILPTWPRDWWRNVQVYQQPLRPLWTWPGPLLLLALIRWRDDRARRFLALCLVPHQAYDLILLWDVPRTRVQALILTVLSFAVLPTWFAWSSSTLTRTLWLLYLPALALVLWPRRVPWVAPRRISFR